MKYYLQFPDEEEWHEYELVAIKNMADSGNLDPNAWAAKEGMQEWARVSDIPELAALLNPNEPDYITENEKRRTQTPPAALGTGSGSPLGGKIMAGGDQNFNVSNHHETNIHHYDQTKELRHCMVSGRSGVVTDGATCSVCNKWVLTEFFIEGRQICRICEDSDLSERESSYRQLVNLYLHGDHLIDAAERQKLDQKASELGLTSEQARRIESESRQLDEASVDLEMTQRAKAQLKRAHLSFYEDGDVKKAYRHISGLEGAYSQRQEFAELYVLILIEVDPAKGLEFLSESPHFSHDSPLKSLRLIELHEAMDCTNEAEKEEQRASRIFPDDRLVKAKSLERLIDLYYEDDQEQWQYDDIQTEAEMWIEPRPDDDPYLHFVHAYLEFSTGKREHFIPLSESDKARAYLLRKQRFSQTNKFINDPDLSPLDQDHDLETEEEVRGVDFDSAVAEKHPDLGEGGLLGGPEVIDEDEDENNNHNYWKIAGLIIGILLLLLLLFGIFMLGLKAYEIATKFIEENIKAILIGSAILGWLWWKNR